MQTLYFDLRDTKGPQKGVEEKISAAAKILRDGGLLGIPTETVYGLAANGLDPVAVKRIFEAKGRPQDNPLILTIPGQQWLPRYCRDIPAAAYELARRFWPGPLTMVLRRRDNVPDQVTAGLDTVGMRCPAHPLCRAVIQAADVPVIFFNREPVEEDLRRWEGAYYVGAYAEQGGRLQGQLVLDAWREDAAALDRSGDGVLQYVVLEGEAGHQDTLLRTEYSIQTLTAGGMEIEKLASATANWQRSQASARMNQWLQQYGDAMEAVFANNDDMALGAIDACLSAGMTVEELPYIVGVDATEPALEAVRNGTLKGTVCNDAAGQAKSIVALSCALLDGEAPESAVELEDGKYVWLPYASVTAENLEDHLKTE